MVNIKRYEIDHYIEYLKGEGSMEVHCWKIEGMIQ